MSIYLQDRPDAPTIDGYRQYRSISFNIVIFVFSPATNHILFSDRYSAVSFSMRIHALDILLDILIDILLDILLDIFLDTLSVHTLYSMRVLGRHVSAVTEF